MDNGLNFPISITTIGIEKVSQVPALFNNIVHSAEGVKTALPPFNDLMRVLTNIEKILTEIGHVSVGSYNTLNDIWSTNYQGFNKAKGHAEKLEKEIDKIGSTSKKSGKEVQSGFLDKFNKIGFAIQSVKNIASTVSGVLSPIFQEGMSRQNAVTDFSTLLGIPDPEEARAMAQKYADDLRSTNAATLYGAGTLNDNAKSMLAYGVDAETSFQILESLGDVAMGDANKMNSLATAFSQMWSLGKLQTQDWKQMVGAGFNPFNQMQKDLGKTTEELDEMMSKGKITAEMTRDAFLHATQASYYDIEGKIQYATDKESLEKAQKEFDEANEKLAAEGKQKKEWKVEKGQFFGALQNTMDNTLQGKMATLNSAIDDIKAKVFEIMVPVALKAITIIKDKLMPIVERLVPVINGVAAVIIPIFKFIGDHIDTILTLVTAIGVVIGITKAWIAVQTVINAVLTANPIGVVVMAIAAMVAVVAVCIEKWDEWGQIVIWLCGAFGLIVNIIQNIKKHWDSIVEAFESGGLIGGIKRIGIVLLDCVLSPLSKAMEYLSDLTGWKWAADFKNTVQLWRYNLDLLEVPDKTDKGEDETDSTQTDLETLVKGGGGSGNGGKGLKTATESVASGGTRNTQITINLGNIVENVNFNGTPADNEQSVMDVFTEQLLRVLYSAQTAV